MRASLYSLPFYTHTRARIHTHTQRERERERESKKESHVYLPHGDKLLPKEVQVAFLDQLSCTLHIGKMANEEL